MTADQQSNIHFTSIPYTQREMSDNEVLDTQPHQGHGQKIRMNLWSTKTAINDKDYYYHAGPLLAEHPKHVNEPREESTRTQYHIKQCAPSRVLEGEAAMVFNEAPKGKDQEQEETYRYKTPTDEIFHKVYDLHDEMEQKMYTDQTGHVPTKSYKGMQYIMVLVELDSNTLLVEAMRDRTSGEMIQACQILVNRLKNKVLNQ